MLLHTIPKCNFFFFCFVKPTLKSHHLGTTGVEDTVLVTCYTLALSAEVRENYSE
jgi:hypothetical protein